MSDDYAVGEKRKKKKDKYREKRNIHTKAAEEKGPLTFQETKLLKHMEIKKPRKRKDTKNSNLFTEKKPNNYINILDNFINWSYLPRIRKR